MREQYTIPAELFQRMHRAHAALEFVADMAELLEVRSELLGKATGTAHPMCRKHCELHAGGMAEFCALISDELRAGLVAARYGVDEESDEEPGDE